jgi:hypothetical protein
MAAGHCVWAPHRAPWSVRIFNSGSIKIYPPILISYVNWALVYRGREGGWVAEAIGNGKEKYKEGCIYFRRRPASTTTTCKSKLTVVRHLSPSAEFPIFIWLFFFYFPLFRFPLNVRLIYIHSPARYKELIAYIWSPFELYVFLLGLVYTRIYLFFICEGYSVRHFV